MKDLHNLTFSKEFMERWKFVLKELYHYSFYEEFAVVPSLWGKKTYSYLPLLSYTDRTIHQISDLLGKLENKNYQLRVLNPDFRDFQDLDTVTMRIDLQKKDTEELFQMVASKRNRRYIRQQSQESTDMKKGNSRELIQDFYEIFADVMHKHGTPVFSRRLFELLSQNLEATFYVLYGNNIPQSGAVVLDDEQISWIPWSGTRSQYQDQRPGLIMYWETIKDAFLKNKRIYDFGRSSYGGGTYIFKTRWSAVPVKIDIFQPRPDNVYKKYNYASRIWKKIPSGFARRLGPKICRYLSDL
jgi:lipid II:glycine glycyltransferase (peptidoglycan interpeptide bridge formation enzyme)